MRADGVIRGGGTENAGHKNAESEIFVTRMLKCHQFEVAMLVTHSTHLLSEQSVIGTSSLLLLLSRRIDPAAFKAQLVRCAPVRMP